MDFLAPLWYIGRGISEQGLFGRLFPCLCADTLPGRGWAVGRFVDPVGMTSTCTGVRGHTGVLMESHWHSQGSELPPEVVSLAGIKGY